MTEPQNPMTEPMRVKTQNISPNISKLLDVMARLRTPVTGCPWDIAQNFSSIAPYTIEEAYEVTDAIQRGDMDDLKEELGDLLLQVVFHARMAEEKGLFTFDDVVAGISEKMIRRHPHVFAQKNRQNVENTTEGEATVRLNWDAIKRAEKAEKGKPPAQSLMDDVPMTLPAMMRAVKLQKRAATIGFDWQDAAPIFDKLQEETLELQEAMQTGDKDRIEDEYGDLLFVMANLARHLNLDPETSIQRGNNKFSTRFKWMEGAAKKRNIDLSAQSLAQLEVLWQQAKVATS